jgi:hypothetical protein
MSKIAGRTVKKAEDGVSADIGQPVLAAILRSMKVGDSVDVISQEPPAPRTQTAEELGPRAKADWRLGISQEGPGLGDARVSDSPVYLTKLEREPLGIPGHGRTSPGTFATTSRADTLAVESDHRVGGNDEGGSFVGDRAGPDVGTLAVPSPLITDRTSGGPIPADAGRETNLKRPVAHKHVGEEGDSA